MALRANIVAPQRHRVISSSRAKRADNALN